MPFSKQKNIRFLALQILKKWDKGGVFAESLVEFVAREHRLSSPDRGLLNAIVNCVIRHRRLIDFWINEMREGLLESETRYLLQVGMAQLLLLKIPPHAAVNETVACAHPKVRGLINAILRGSQRIAKTLKEKSESSPLGVKYSHPDWLVEHWTEVFGSRKVPPLLRWNNKTPKTYLRRNPLVKFSGKLPQNVQPVPDLEDWLEITESLPHELLASGAWYAADLSTRHATELMAARPGESILDACSAPGGKTVAMAGMMDNFGEIVATDLPSYRIESLRGNIKRLNVLIAKVHEADWAKSCPPPLENRFDGVLTDVPCSNTGVMQRRVDVRWRLSMDELQRLAELQLAILTNASIAVKPEGRIVYSTCSIEPMENRELVDVFLSKKPEWALIEERTVTPFKDETDGSYSALLKRKQESTCG